MKVEKSKIQRSPIHHHPHHLSLEGFPKNGTINGKYDSLKDFSPLAFIVSLKFVDSVNVFFMIFYVGLAFLTKLWIGLFQFWIRNKGMDVD